MTFALADSRHRLIVQIVEFVPNGSLRDILQDVQRQFDWSTRTQVAQQIANGMLYLHGMSIVHGNLTSHACLLTSRMEAKVGYRCSSDDVLNSLNSSLITHA